MQHETVRQARADAIERGWVGRGDRGTLFSIGSYFVHMADRQSFMQHLDEHGSALTDRNIQWMRHKRLVRDSPFLMEDRGGIRYLPAIYP